MYYRSVEQRNPLVNPGDVRIPAGMYAALTLYFHGTAQSTKTITKEMLGTILVRHRGRNIVNCRVQDLYLYSELAAGYARWNSAISAAFECFVIIPFRYGEMPCGKDDNLLNCGPDELHITIPGVDPLEFLTCVVDIGAIRAPGVARFIPAMSSQAVLLTLNAPVRLSLPNLRRLLVDETSITTPPTTMFALRGGNEVLFEGSWAELECLSDAQWYREAAALNAVMTELGRDDLASYVGGRYDLRLIGGVGTAYVTEFGAIPVSRDEFHAVRAVQIGQMEQQFQSSPEPPSSDVAPADPETASSGAQDPNSVRSPIIADRYRGSVQAPPRITNPMTRQVQPFVAVPLPQVGV